jgi:RNA methyltransferase, TrmH family
MKPQHGEVASFCRTLARARKPYRQVEPAELARIADTVLNGGIVAIARPRPLHDFDLEAAPEIAEAWARDGQPLLILDGIGNPLNLGVIVRSAAYFGIERILLADRPEQALPSDASYRVAEGGFEHLSLYRFAVPNALEGLRRVYWIVGTALDQRPVPQTWHCRRPVALILGNEETGLDPATIAACDDVVTIAGSGRVQSLNVAAAAAILMYLLTQR